MIAVNRTVTSVAALLGLIVASGCGGPAAEVGGPDGATVQDTEQRLPVAGVDDEEFVRRATSSGMFMVESARYALQQLQDDEAAVAGELQEDHGILNRQLENLAEGKNFRAPGEMLPRHREMLRTLKSDASEPRGERFLEAQRQAHVDAIELYDACSKLCLDRDLRRFASTALLMLRDHLADIAQRQ